MIAYHRQQRRVARQIDRRIDSVKRKHDHAGDGR